jgi:SAM-dependent methyltransferase
MREMVKKLVPVRTRKKLRHFQKVIKYRGSKRYCPVCSYSVSQFLSFAVAGVPPWEDVLCPICDSLERHRLAWLFLQRKTDLFSPKTSRKMLHVAPEDSFESRLRPLLGSGYLTADFLTPNVDVKMDIMDIQFPDETFDIIFCSHVLEHVPDDKKAMREFLRVLKRDGWAVLLVPINVDRTVEDPSITDPKERLRLFGQEDHVRRYGPDYLDRLKEAGFVVSRIPASDFLSEDERERMRVGDPANAVVFYCQRPPSQ